MFAMSAMAQRPRQQPASKGIALISVLLALLLVTLLGFALTGFGIIALTVTTNEREATEALYIAEAGITHARNMVVTQVNGGVTMTTVLQGGNGTACDGDELSPAPPAPLVAGDAIPAGGVAFPPGGSYRVFVCDDHAVESVTNNPPNLPDINPDADANGAILVRSVGTGRNGATATLEITISEIPLPGLLVDGDLRINGNPALTGPGGAAHSNGALDLPGVPCAEDYFSSTTTITGGGETGSGCASNPPGGSDSPPDERPGESPIPVPQVQPSDYRANADWILQNDGTLVEVSTGITHNTGQAKILFDWDWDPGNRRWVAGNNIPAGTVYADDGPSGTPGSAAAATNIEVSGNPGTGPPGTPALSATLIATGYINISGNPNFQPDLTVGTASISMVAGTDLKISGNPSTIYQGLHYAGHQIGFSGNPVINGQVIADNQADFGTPTNLLVLVGTFMEVSGNPTINYTGGGGLVAVNQTAWRECRGPNPAAPCQ